MTFIGTRAPVFTNGSSDRPKKKGVPESVFEPKCEDKKIFPSKRGYCVRGFRNVA